MKAVAGPRTAIRSRDADMVGFDAFGPDEGGEVFEAKGKRNVDDRFVLQISASSLRKSGEGRPLIENSSTSAKKKKSINKPKS